MLEVFLFVVTVILVVVFWPIFIFLGLAALGLVVLVVAGGLALAFPKKALGFAVFVGVSWAVVALWNAHKDQKGERPTALEVYEERRRARLEGPDD